MDRSPITNGDREILMITFLWIGALVILLVAAIGVAYGASQRKRSGQSGQAKVNAQHSGEETPTVGRPTGIN